MTVELKTYYEGDMTFLAAGKITYEIELDLPHHAERADGEEEWFLHYEDALSFIAKGLKRSTQWTLED